LSRCFDLIGKTFLDLGDHPKMWRKLDGYSKIKVPLKWQERYQEKLSC
jgi:hypothetical protein